VVSVYSLNMTDDRKSGIALVVGALGAILTMAIHPGEPWLPAGYVQYLAPAAHSIGILALLLLFLGSCGLARRIASSDRISLAGIVAYGFACVAALIGMAISGFTMPAIVRHMARDVPTAAPEWRIVMDGIFQINQAVSRIFFAGASLAIFLWSMCVLRNGGLARGIAIYGCVIAPLTILALAAGHLRPDVHGTAAVVLAQAVWFIVVGTQLWFRAAGAMPQ
jgi:hypothetical protein